MSTIPSLALIPSGYKASKVYSVLPTDGSGDLTFTRALDTATRVGPDGLIEKVRTNLFLQSQTFDNAYWSKGNTTVTANATTAPDGTLTAEKIVATTTGTDRRIQRSESISAGIYTNSIFVKASELNIVRMYGVDFSSQATFSLTGSGSVSGVLGGATANIESLPNGWYRCSVSVSFAGGSTQTLYFNIGNALGGATINAGDGVFIWGAQLETGDIATPYIPTTTAAVSVGMLANVPRLDYLGGGCPKLLLEPQRTNLVTFSEQINNAAWTKGNATISANVSATIDPSGFNGADKLQEDSSTDSHFFGSDTASATTGQVVTFSVFLKKAERNFAALRLFSGTTSLFAWFNLDTGVIGQVTAGATASIVEYNNDWYRCSLTITMVANSVSLPYVFASNADGVTSYAGTAGHGIFVYGCQQEIGSYATSYIPTLGAAVTRSVDLASKDSLSVFGTNVGSFFVDAEGPFFDGVAGYLFDLSDNSSDTSNRFGLYSINSTTLQLFTNTATNITASVTARKKILVIFSGTNTKVYLNGVKVVDIAYANANPTSINLNCRFTEIEHGNSMFHQVLAFPIALSDADAIALTA